MSVEREELPVDILFVGAGPACLTSALHLKKQLVAIGQGDVEIAVIEKAQSVGAHILSGAVVDPRPLVELLGEDWRDCGLPVESWVDQEEVRHLSANGAFRIPVPPMLKNHGFPVISLSEMVIWLKDRCEEAEVMIFEGFPGHQFLHDANGHIAGVRTMDKGLDANGNPGPGFEPGADISAKCTVLGEGVRGSLTRQLIDDQQLQGRNPQIYGTGGKELWKLPDGRFPAGKVLHTSGWPLSSTQYGGSWIYGLSGDRVSIGFVTALDARQPSTDPWENFQRWKQHPFISKILEGGEILKAGAKCLPEGGYWSRPRPWGNGFLIIGDAGSNLNVSRLKGVHTSMKTGLIAAETLLEAIRKDDFSGEMLCSYEERFNNSWLKQELWRVRNYRAEFQGRGFWSGAIRAGFKYVLGGIGKDFVPLKADHDEMLKLHQADPQPEPLEYDGKKLIDKVTQVYHSGAVHAEQQPSHLKVADPDLCISRCKAEYGNPCQHFCPANVYEIVDDGKGQEKLQINHSNCVHCKTCDILDPYQVITWTVPSDAGGPKYLGL
ncbi:MAG: electron transfer flavoprotein-ubiquinone oxidoreductase [Planctomycetota bacterium]|nr:electron transfer flavoprotein-ubiquinone oxidoreductase [Planctomycetota bacterium]